MGGPIDDRPVEQRAKQGISAYLGIKVADKMA